MKMKLKLAISLALGLAAQPLSAEETRLNFVSCPIVRDTSTVPCWLTEHQGVLYYLGIQTDVSSEFKPPWLGHQVLVEGVIADAPEICGGVVLKPVRVSVMPELDPSCNTLLPAEDQYKIDFNPRPPGPSGGRLAFEAPGKNPTGKISVQPEDTLTASDPGGFELTFDFDRSIAFHHSRELLKIMTYAQQTSAGRITVTGNWGATLLSDGTVLIENKSTAQRRAEDVARLLAGSGLDVDIDVSWSDQPEPADGVDDWRSRSVIVRVEP
jgi:hypothetical protein